MGEEARCSRRGEVEREKGVETECGRGSVVISAGPELTQRGSDRLPGAWLHFLILILAQYIA